MSELEDILYAQIEATPPMRQHRFHPTRRWLLDFAWPDRKVAVEVDGGTWSGGRHTRGAGFETDCEKLNEAAIMGWRVLRVTGTMVKDGRAIEYVNRILEET